MKIIKTGFTTLFGLVFSGEEPTSKQDLNSGCKF